MLFGLYQMGIFGISSVLGKEHRLPFRLDRFAMSPVTALLMGFTFSFAWTPCVGPALYKRPLMAGICSDQSSGLCSDRRLHYGFVLPFCLWASLLLSFWSSLRNTEVWCSIQ